MISAFRAVFGSLFHAARHSERSEGATHVDTLGLPSTRHPEALAEDATQRICTRVSEAKLVPTSKTTLLRAVQIQDHRHIRFCIAFNSCKILKQVQDDSAVGTFDKNRRAAFTLAEVLITLGIIGVVAALTIPTLISKFQEKALESQFKKTYSMLSQALQFTTYENGSEYKCYTQDKVTSLPDPTGASQVEYSECTKFHKSFFQNLKYVKVEFVNEHPYKTRNEVVAEGGTVSNNACNISFIANTNKYYLQDGSIIYALTRINYSQALYFVLDINGDKGPNKWGYDVFYLGPTKKDTGVLRIAENRCIIREKGGKSVEDILKR